MSTADLDQLAAEGGSPALDAIRQVMREELSAVSSPVITEAEAMAITKHRSARTFSNWRNAHKVRQIRQDGTYSREAIIRALNRDLRKRTR